MFFANQKTNKTYKMNRGPMSWTKLLSTLYWRGIPLSYEFLRDASKSVQNSDSFLKDRFPIRFHSKLKHWRQKGQKEILWCQENQVLICHPLHPLYPKAFLNFPTPPTLTILSQKNSLPVPLSSLSVVGSRNPSENSKKWMEVHFKNFLSKKRRLIVSGGARGIDQMAHALCLRTENPTLVFLPSGLNHIYPSHLSSWIQPILKGGGAFISCFSPFSSMKKFYFHIRNHLIACFTPLTFVVEAKRKSGSLLTANYAIEEGKEVATLPCSPMDPSGQGNLDLLFEGAHLIRDDSDLFQLMEKLDTYSSSRDSSSKEESSLLSFCGPPSLSSFTSSSN
ncbi:MAG: DNA-processing protein DprA [Bdellovibrio sp.]|nr:MAG: DNA-processing protein DprA [Bdellovibrio sp.]